MDSVDSANALLKIASPPVFTQHPESASVLIGANLTLNSLASGSGVTYQWQKNGVNIAGATAAELTILNAQPNHAGTYTCIASNLNGNATSKEAVISIQSPPIIIEHPEDVNASANDIVIFSVTAEGEGKLSYQWQKDGADIQGESGVHITHYMKRFNSQTRKWLQDGTGSWCFITPGGILFTRGRQIELNATFWDDPELLIGPNFLAISKADASNAGTYRCVVTNAHGSITSGNATLSMVAPPIITVDPADQEVDVNGTITFTVTANGVGLSYQWQKDGINIAGANNASFVVSNAQASDVGYYRVIVSNAHGTVTSKEGTLTVRTPPAFITHPSDVNATANDSVLLVAQVQAVGAITYQWQKDGVNINQGSGITITSHIAQHDSKSKKWLRDGNGNWCHIKPNGVLYQGGKKHPVGVEYWNNPEQLIGPNFFTVQNVDASNAGQYRCIATSPHGTATSNSATLSITAPPKITGQPVSITVNANATATFSVTASGTGLSYEWKKDGSIIVGATLASYTIANTSISDMGSYQCTVTNIHGATVSNSAELTVMAPPVITNHPNDVNATAGQTVTFSAKATGAGTLQYQWQKNGVNVVKGIQFSITEHFNRFDRPTRKWLRDSSGNWCYINNQGVLHRRGAKITLGAAAFNDPSTIVGLHFHAISNITSADAGNYRCVVSNPAGSTNSNVGELKVP